MADKPDKPPTPSSAENPLRGTEDTLPKEYQRASHEILYESIMSSGGEAFGKSLGPGITTLTMKSVRRFRKKGHFYISTFESFDDRKKNPFTRAGSSNMVREYTPEAIEFAADPSKFKRPWWKRLLGIK